MSRILLQQALDALNHAVMSSGGETGCEHQLGICFCAEIAAIEALRTELSKPNPAPVAWLMVNERYPDLGKPIFRVPPTDWHITWKAIPLYLGENE